MHRLDSYVRHFSHLFRFDPNSNHPFKKYPNLTFNLVPTKANQLWMSYITYIRFGRTFYYLSIITDAYSRKIVHWHLSEDLKAEGFIKALQTLPENILDSFIILIGAFNIALKPTSKIC